LAFYALAGEPWFLVPMLVTLFLDFFVAQKIHFTKSEKTKNLLLYVSVGTNLLMLGFFKYSGMLAGTIDAALSSLKFFPHSSEFIISILKVGLPAGISFYTFQSISYIVDVYRGTAEPETNFWSYASFISFFPHLVAGPLTRHNQLLPNLSKISREGIHPKWPEGIYLFICGLAKKLIIADRIGEILDMQMVGLSSHSFVTGWLLMTGFAFQLYFDFSGYSDMAIGLARIFDVELPQNFNAPFRSVNPADFWRRWHITLGSWLRDYLFNPLAYFFIRRGWPQMYGTGMALMLTMTLGGLWHGANWTYGIFGIYHGLLIVIYFAFRKKWNHWPKGLQIFLTFWLVSFGWIFFRSESVSQIGEWFVTLGRASGWHTDLQNPLIHKFALLQILGFVFAFWFPVASQYPKFGELPKPAQVAFAVLSVAVLFFMNFTSKFLYFQF
jgi:alginate O-acetyltransferase complex protein AlgI